MLLPILRSPYRLPWNRYCDLRWKIRNLKFSWTTWNPYLFRRRDRWPCFFGHNITYLLKGGKGGMGWSDIPYRRRPIRHKHRLFLIYALTFYVLIERFFKRQEGIGSQGSALFAKRSKSLALMQGTEEAPPTAS